MFGMANKEQAYVAGVIVGGAVSIMCIISSVKMPHNIVAYLGIIFLGTVIINFVGTFFRD